MFVAMNRFRIKRGEEEAFEHMWKNRDSHLAGVHGFESFHLLKGETHEDHTLYSTHTVWKDRESFTAWTQSDAFKKAHQGATSRRDFYLGPPKFEGFESVLAQ